uniref:Lipocalin n=1 Tax=Rhipicephalus zambeziensis TaxID=60191 RepID=A0A224YIN1_9ACAR
MDSVCVAVLLTTMLSNLIYCEQAHDFSKLPDKDKFMLGNASELLNSNESLVLYWGANGAMSDNRVCWTSQKYGNSTTGVNHNITFRTNETKLSAGNFTEVSVTGEYIVSPKDKIPTVLLTVHDRRVEGLGGDYTLLAANPACFVMGEIIPKNPRDSKCLFWMREGTSREERSVCDDAVSDNCTSLQGTFYFMSKYKSFCNFSTYRNTTTATTSS